MDAASRYSASSSPTHLSPTRPQALRRTNASTREGVLGSRARDCCASWQWWDTSTRRVGSSGFERTTRDWRRHGGRTDVSILHFEEQRFCWPVGVQGSRISWRTCAKWAWYGSARAGLFIRWVVSCQPSALILSLTMRQAGPLLFLACFELFLS